MSNHEHVPTEDGWKAEYDEQPPSVWEHHDPYQFAPPKPDGDTWRIVLEPLIKKDKMRCEAWKDEVQNLLIFAGLFSAVATAFVIESYKSLQPDPVENLVLVITSSLNSSTISVPPFTPTASSVRVNICWFLSLVLSLTTVLVGIVSLQWLREHQSYPNLTRNKSYLCSACAQRGLKNGASHKSLQLYHFFSRQASEATVPGSTLPDSQGLGR
ncbi:hypothetical protein CVT25_005028 [Psilocybe cyanescens]|uniref:DUF6535 domain-containing protein n=1 Tax=Psilocybe cyanescens TaxID=93625 RepID=A0A409XIZ6_PSICY|nr:hypothetical protein CVT25_005028 [Psilocybe cyanescens]